MKLAPCFRFWATVACGLALLPQGAMACKCAPTRPACEVIGSSSIVFVGTVTDTGPTIGALQAEFRRKFSQKEIERLENSGDLSLSEEKRIWERLLPKGAQGRLKRVRTKDELQQLAVEYFPVLRQWDRPVRFTVDETFKGEPTRIREVWTGQGFGDCGFDFELGHKYLVYGYRDEDTGRDQTNVCSRTRVFDEASADVAYLRASRDGMRKPTIFGIVTLDLDEFRKRALWWTDGPTGRPASGVQLSLKSGDDEFYTQTNASGQFAFADLRAGEYRLSAVSEGFRFTGVPKTVELKAASCSANAILAQPAK